MTDKPKKLSATARMLLTTAAMRADRLIHPPQLPIAAARQVARSLLGSGLAEEMPTPDKAADFAWPVGDGGRSLVLRATAVGLARIADRANVTAASVANDAMAEAAAHLTEAGSDDGNAATALAPTTGQQSSASACHPDQDAQAAERAPGTPRRARHPDVLWEAAQVLLDAWDELPGSDIRSLAGPVADLRAAMMAKEKISTLISATRAPQDTKTAQALAMLRRDEGASGPQIADAMGWAPHTVRGFLAGLAKKGIVVEVIERVRQVGPNNRGSKGSYTVYRVAGELERHGSAHYVTRSASLVRDLGITGADSRAAAA